MAILFGESFSSTIPSSSFGPAVRTGAAAPLRNTRTKCSGFTTSTITSKQARINAAALHPRPPRGGGWEGKRGGGAGAINGGAAGGVGGLLGGKFVSIAPKRYCNR